MAEDERGLIGVGVFLAESWKIYQAKLWVLLLIGGLGGAVSMASGALPLIAAFLLAPTSPIIWTPAILIALSGFLWFASWAQVAAMEAVLSEGPVTLKDCYRISWPKIIPFSWICILWLLFTVGGCFLLAIPGIYLAVALCFAPFACVAGQKGEFDLLLESLALVRGRWWEVFGKLFLAGFLSGLPSLIPVVGPILGMICAPFSLAAMALLFQDLKKTAQPRQSASDFRSKILLVVCGLALAIPVVLAARSILYFRGRGPGLQVQLQSLLGRAAPNPGSIP